VGIWYGMSKIGVTTALINTNLRSKVLLHSIEVAKPKLVIYDEELEHGIYVLIICYFTIIPKSLFKSFLKAIIQLKNEFIINMDFIRQGITLPFIPNVSQGVLEKLLEYSSDILYEDKEVSGNGNCILLTRSASTNKIL
jgi:hypothetical protein